jgi:outer membrane protein assembly factor BamB
MRHIIRMKMALTVCLFILCTLTIPAQDWPQWRGPHRDGKASGFSAPEKWPTNLVKQWTTPVGKGDSSPALVGHKLYTFGRLGTDEVVQCLDTDDGKVLWADKYPANLVVTGPSAGHPGPRSTLVVTDGKVCALGVGAILSCLDAATGKMLWRKQTTNDYLGIPFRSDASMSPLVDNGLCFVHVGGRTNAALFAFELAQGEPKWKWQGEGPANSSPVIMMIGGKKHLVTFTSKNLVGLAAEDGRLLWQMPFEAVQGNNTTPIVDGSTLYFTGQGKGLSAVKIEAKDIGFNVTTLWSNSQLGARFTTPVHKDGLLFGYTTSLFCAKAQTGELLWSDTSKRGPSAAIVDADTQLIALTQKGELIAFKPSPTEYVELARIPVTTTEAWAHPVVSGKYIFIRDADTVTRWSIE